MKVEIRFIPEKDERDVSIASNIVLRALQKRNYDCKANIHPKTGRVTIAVKGAFKRGQENENQNLQKQD